MFISPSQYMPYAPYDPCNNTNTNLNQQYECTNRNTANSDRLQMSQTANEMFNYEIGNFSIAMNPFVGNDPNIYRQPGFSDYNLFGNFCRHAIGFFGSFQRVIQSQNQVQSYQNSGLDYMA